MFSVRVRCGETERLKKFRRKRPVLTRWRGGRMRDDVWKKRPLNRQYFRDLTEEETKAVLRDPMRNRDPYDRLEFFEKGELDSPFDSKIPETALPIERPDVVRATEAREKIIKKIDKIRTDGLKKMLEDGRMTMEELMELRDRYKISQENPATAEIVKEELGIRDDMPYVQYPEEGDEALIDRSKMSFVDQLTFDYNVPGYVEFENQSLKGGVETPTVRLTHCNGEEIIISLHGGCILAWLDPVGRNRLFDHPDEVFDNVSPISSSGIGFAFPQFGKMGNLPQDGFVNRMLWDVVRSEVGADWLPDPAPSVTLHCKDTEETRQIWPHKFEIFYKITLGEIDEYERFQAPTKEQRRFQERLAETGSLQGVVEDLKQEEKDLMDAMKKAESRGKRRRGWRTLKEQKETTEPEDNTPKMDNISEPIPTQIRIQVAVRNKGDKPMEFTCACRTHFQIRGLHEYGDYVRILGLGGRSYLDFDLIPGKPILRLWNQDYLKLGERDLGWDAIFTENTMNDVFFCPGWIEYFESITRKGFPDVLLVQPGPQHPEDYLLAAYTTMLGRGRVTVPAKVEPGEVWEGEYVLRHHNHFYEEPVFGYQDGVPPPDERDIKPPIEETPLKGIDVRD